MRILRKDYQIIFLALLMLPVASEAHPFNLATESEGLIGGLTHPLTNSDHILTMLAVGLWVSQATRYWAYSLPVVFVSLMLTDGMLPLLAIEIPFAKYMMYISVIALGMMLAGAYKTPQAVGGLIVAAVAFFHGYVHVYDMMLDIGGPNYMTGFAITTMLLIVAGVISRSLINYIFLKINGGFLRDESE
ncbi:MAG: hypothetical protein CTY19_01855 [Methylomonas sp.]|nr:MAG: hypothetical protein CTY19_01855 [Methylomonas sp.]